jgi:hypothetical protein
MLEVEVTAMTGYVLDTHSRLARKTKLALTIAIVLGAVEILRRSPRWPLLLVALLAYSAVVAVVLYIWWIVGALALVAGGKLAGGGVRGWREG